MKKIILFTLSLFIISACNTTKLVYDYGDKYVSWQLDSYFELNDEQEDWVEERMKTHLEWHRAQELPHYKRFLTDIQNSAKDGLTMSELDEGYSRFEAKQRRTFARLIPDAALFMTKLSPEQINNLERKMTEENEQMLTKVENRQERIQNNGGKIFWSRWKTGLVNLARRSWHKLINGKRNGIQNPMIQLREG